jgi:hypothetical protein
LRGVAKTAAGSLHCRKTVPAKSSHGMIGSRPGPSCPLTGRTVTRTGASTCGVQGPLTRKPSGWRAVTSTVGEDAGAVQLPAFARSSSATTDTQPGCQDSDRPALPCAVSPSVRVQTVPAGCACVARTRRSTSRERFGCWKSVAVIPPIDETAVQ